MLCVTKRIKHIFEKRGCNFRHFQEKLPETFYLLLTSFNNGLRLQILNRKKLLKTFTQIQTCCLLISTNSKQPLAIMF